MHPVLQSCQIILEIVRTLIAGVAYFGCGGSGAVESDFVATRAAAGRLGAGLRLAEAYLRRVLLVMALEMEATLVDGPKPPLRRPRETVRKPVRRAYVFQIFPKVPAMPEAVLFSMRNADVGKPTHKAVRGQSKPVFIGALKARLHTLSQIAADPVPRARRLAYHLARNKHGPFFAPDRHIHTTGRLGRLRHLWGTEASATFDAMAYDIETKSRIRPPPLPPRRRYGPSILVLGG